MSTPSPFTPEQYTWLHPGKAHGPAKLASSAVAPLVAAARGYETAMNIRTARELGIESFEATAKRLGMGDGRSAQRRLLGLAVGDEDALVMPWMSVGSVATANRAGLDRAGVAAYQLRPMSAVYLGDNDEPSKYIWPKGESTQLDVHPVMPLELIEHSGRFMIAEGLLKADSALTAQLLGLGVPYDELANDHRGNQDAARAVLSRILRDIDPATFTLIVGIVGVGTWHRHTAWNSIDLTGRPALVAFDADAASNPQVWRQASKMVEYLTKDRKAPSARLVSVPPVNGDTKAGMDDAFAAGHTWAEVESWLTDLPPAPEGAIEHHKAGDVFTDFDKGLTLVMGENNIPTTLAEAAIQIDVVRSKRAPWDPNFIAETFYDGRIRWVGREGKVEERTFTNKPAQLIATGVLESILIETTDGEASGADLPDDPKERSAVRRAWRKTANEATREVRYASSGLMEVSIEGEAPVLAWHTSKGAITADGFETRISGDVGEVPEIDIPYVGPDERAGEAFRKAWWEVYNQKKLFTHPYFWYIAIGGVHATAHGREFSPAGGVVITGLRGAGKTEYMRLWGLAYGPKWAEDVAVVTNGTAAQLRDAAAAAHCIFLSMDDAIVKRDSRGYLTKDSEIRIKATEDSLRGWYDPTAKPTRKLPSPSGRGHVNEKIRADMSQSGMISTENVEGLDWHASTIQRSLILDVPHHFALLAKEGEIGPAIAKLKKSGASRLILGGDITAMLETVAVMHEEDGLSIEDARAKFAEEGHQSAHDWLNQKIIQEGLDIPTRNAELLIPLMAGWQRFAELGPQEMFESVVHEGWEGILEAYKAHTKGYSADADRPYLPILEALSEALATGKAAWYNSEEKTYAPIIGRNDFGEGSKNKKPGEGDIALLAGECVKVLRDYGMNFTPTTFWQALNDLRPKRSSIRVTPGTDKTTSCRVIPRDAWPVAKDEDEARAAHVVAIETKRHAEKADSDDLFAEHAGELEEIASRLTEIRREQRRENKAA